MRVSIVLIGLGVVLGFSTSVRAIDPAVKCGADKIKEAVKYAFCLGKEEAKAIKKDTDPSADITKCDSKFSLKWQKIEDKGGADCPSTADKEVIQAQIEQVVAGLVTDLEPLPPPGSCLPSAVEVGGACWYLGNSGEGCDTACAIVGLVYDSATETYAGSGGTLPQCEAVLNALGIGQLPVQLSCPIGIGCNLSSIGTAEWCSSPTTDLSSGSAAERICACQ